MSVSGERDDYETGNGRPGIALIISISQLADDEQTTRKGADKDHQLLVDTFKTLQFDVRDFKDLTKDGILEKVAEVSRDESLKESDCLVVAISTHGKTEERRSDDDCVGYDMFETVDMLWGTDEAVEVRDIYKQFNEVSCPHLKNKPKIFFLQGCRGKQLCETVQIPIRHDEQTSHVSTSRDHSDVTDATRSQACFSAVGGKHRAPPSTLVMDETEPQDEPMELESAVVAEMPTAAGDQEPAEDPMQVDEETEKEKIVSHRNDISRDYLAMWGSPVGYYAFHTKDGSPLIQKLKEVLLADHNKDDLLTMLTKVNRLVATTYESRTNDEKTNKRHIVPSISHMLRKKVFFKSNQNSEIGSKN